MVFVDIYTKYGNLCPDKVQSKINKNTGEILARHNYRFPVELEKLELISKKYGIPLIYDGVPSIGVKANNERITCFGIISVLSFHLTKVFKTF